VKTSALCFLAVFFLLGCGKSDQPQPPGTPPPGQPSNVGKWSQPELDREVQTCASGSGEMQCNNGGTGGLDATAFCRCVYTAIAQTYTFAEYNQNRGRIEQEMQRNGTVSRCEQSSVRR